MTESDNYFIRQIELESCNKTLTVYQQAIGDVCCVVWDGGLVLLKYLDKQNERSNWLKGKKVLELGAGTGCVGMTAACFGAQVVLTDLDSAIPLIDKNISANENVWKSVGGSVKAQTYDWDSNEELDFQPDIILVSDCVYYEKSLKPLLQVLEKLLIKEGSYVLLSQEERCSDEKVKLWRTFLNELKKKFNVVVIPQEEHHDRFNSPAIPILKISKT